jgi:putative transposase
MGEARAHLKDYFVFYNSVRPHQSLDEMTPDEVYFNNAGAKKHAA